MRAMSFVQAWFFGLVAFGAMTLSLALAFSIAITGPPTDEEMEGLEGVLNRASHQVAVIAGQLGEEACTQLPPEATSGLCPAQTVATEETPQRSTPIEETPEPPVAAERGVFSGEEGALAQNSVGEADLLGSEERADPATPPRAEARAPERRAVQAPVRRADARRPQRRVAEAPRRARATPSRAPQRAVAAARPPLVGAQVAEARPLPQVEGDDVIAMRARADLAAIAPEEEVVEQAVYERPAGPSQEQAAPAQYAPDEAWSDDEQYDREQSADEEESYYDEYDAYEARRERRERRRARREQQRYYGGW